MLTVKRPTPTTVLYAVSTRTARVTSLALLVVRFIAGTVVVLLLCAKCMDQTMPLKPNATLFDNAIVQSAVQTLVKVPWMHILPVIAGVLWLVFRRGYTEESLLVIRGLGVQTTTCSPTYLSTAATRFIPTSSIQDIFIHEAFKGFEIRYYLSIVVEGEGEVFVVFPTILPRRQVLEDVWRGARACLYGPKT